MVDPVSPTHHRGSARSGRSDATVHAGLIYAVAYDPSASPGEQPGSTGTTIEDQMRSTLAHLDHTLRCCGSSKQSLLQVTVYLADIKDKERMDAVWLDWIGPEENWPARACLQASAGAGTLVELTVIAAVET